MHIYAGLFESTMDCCGRIGLRNGPLYTLTMIALGLAVSLNLLNVIHLLWTLGLYIAFLAVTVLARLQFSTDQGRRQLLHVRGAPKVPTTHLAASNAAAPLYVLASASLFIVTLSIPLRMYG